MPTNEQRRAAAKRKLEHQLERRSRHAKRRKKLLIASGTGAVVIALVAVGLVLYDNHQETVAAQREAAYKAHTCGYAKTPHRPAPKGKQVGLPPDPNPTPDNGTPHVNLKTNRGMIPLTLNRAEAPCTVQSFVHLVKTDFYDNTPCHRLAHSTLLKVLQCGDPTGTGRGGPGYTIPDEKPKHLKPAPGAPGKQGFRIYPKGTVAMVKSAAPDSGGSQFFLAYEDTYLPPDYTIFGTVGKEGLATLHKIVKGGIVPQPNPRTGQLDPNDGKPKLPVTITEATITR